MINLFNVLIYVVLSICVVVLVRELIKGLGWFILTFRSSDTYSYEKDIVLLHSKIYDITNRYIHRHILNGDRKESIIIDKVIIPYDESKMGLHISQISELSLKMLSDRYKERLKTLYISDLEEEVALLVRDIYMAAINKMTDDKQIYNIERGKDISKRFDKKVDIVAELVDLTGSREYLIQTIDEFHGIPDNRLVTMSNTANSDYVRKGAMDMIEIKSALLKRNMSIEDLRNSLES